MVGERYGGVVNATTNTSRVRKKHLKIITYRIYSCNSFTRCNLFIDIVIVHYFSFLFHDAICLPMSIV